MLIELEETVLHALILQGLIVVQAAVHQLIVYDLRPLGRQRAALTAALDAGHYRGRPRSFP